MPFHQLLRESPADQIVEEREARGASEPGPRIRSQWVQIQIVDGSFNEGYYCLDPIISTCWISYCSFAYHDKEQDSEETKVRN